MMTRAIHFGTTDMVTIRPNLYNHYNK